MIEFNKPFEIKVQTRAKQNIIIDNGTFLKIKTTEIPENNRANKIVIELISKKYKISKSSIKIIKGIKNTNKTVLINNL